MSEDQASDEWGDGPEEEYGEEEEDNEENDEEEVEDEASEEEADAGDRENQNMKLNGGGSLASLIIPERLGNRFKPKRWHQLVETQGIFNWILNEFDFEAPGILQYCLESRYKEDNVFVMAAVNFLYQSTGSLHPFVWTDLGTRGYHEDFVVRCIVNTMTLPACVREVAWKFFEISTRGFNLPDKRGWITKVENWRKIFPFMYQDLVEGACTTRVLIALFNILVHCHELVIPEDDLRQLLACLNEQQKKLPLDAVAKKLREGSSMSMAAMMGGKNEGEEASKQIALVTHCIWGIGARSPNLWGDLDVLDTLERMLLSFEIAITTSGMMRVTLMPHVIFFEMSVRNFASSFDAAVQVPGVIHLLLRLAEEGKVDSVTKALGCIHSETSKTLIKEAGLIDLVARQIVRWYTSGCTINNPHIYKPENLQKFDAGFKESNSLAYPLVACMAGLLRSFEPEDIKDKDLEAKFQHVRSRWMPAIHQQLNCDLKLQEHQILALMRDLMPAVRVAAQERDTEQAPVFAYALCKEDAHSSKVFTLHDRSLVDDCEQCQRLALKRSRGENNEPEIVDSTNFDYCIQNDPVLREELPIKSRLSMPTAADSEGMLTVVIEGLTYGLTKKSPSVLFSLNDKRYTEVRPLMCVNIRQRFGKKKIAASKISYLGENLIVVTCSTPVDDMFGGKRGFMVWNISTKKVIFTSRLEESPPTEAESIEAVMGGSILVIGYRKYEANIDFFSVQTKKRFTIKCPPVIGVDVAKTRIAVSTSEGLFVYQKSSEGKTNQDQEGLVLEHTFLAAEIGTAVHHFFEGSSWLYVIPNPYSKGSDLVRVSVVKLNLESKTYQVKSLYTGQDQICSFDIKRAGNNLWLRCRTKARDQLPSSLVDMFLVADSRQLFPSPV